MLAPMRARLLLLAATSVAVSACAAILGIDDGTPRTDDAAVDASQADADAAVDVVVDAGEGGPFVPLKCGQATCNFALGQACCRTGSTSFVCMDAGVTCSGTLIECDRPEMCPPDDAGPVVCCGDLSDTEAGVVASAVSCKSEALCAYSTHAYFCDDAGECPADASCLQSTVTLPTYLICK